MATTDLGRVTPLHRGTYSASAVYELNDVVGYQGGTYWHKTETQTTGVAPTDTTVWARIADSIDAEIFIERAETAAESAETKAAAASASALTAAGSADAATAAAEAASDSAEAASVSALAAADSAEAASASVESTGAAVAALETENRLQGMQIANLKAALYDTVIEDAEHTFAALNAAPIPSHLNDGTEYHKVFGGSELLLDRIVGKTAKYNQLVQISPSGLSKYANGVHFTDNRDGTVTVWTDAGGATADTDIRVPLTSPITIYVKNGHKYFLAGCPKITLEAGELKCYVTYMGGAASKNTNPEVIATANMGDATGQLYPACVARGTVLTNPVKFALRLADLTVMYGAGNEPSTAAEFLADYPAFADYVPYTSGAVDSTELDGIRVSGFNLWDQEWESGDISPIDGSNTQNTARIRSKNFIPVAAGKTYYLHTPTHTFHAYFYDMDHHHVDNTTNQGSGQVGDLNNRAFVIPLGVTFMRIADAANSAGSYAGDVCLNLSDAALNGTFRDYVQPWTFMLPEKKKLYSVGNAADRLEIAPNGTLFDVLLVRNTEVRNYQSGDEIDPTVVTDETRTVVPLTEPVVTTLLSGLTENQVACLTERGGSIAVIGNDSTIMARPNADVILQIEKAVEE